MTDKPKGVVMTLTQWLVGKPLPNRAKESTERNIRAYAHQRDLAQQVTTALNELESTMVAGARRR